MGNAISTLPNLTTLASPTGLDLLLIEALSSGSNTSDPTQNSYITKNIFLKDYLKAIGFSNPNKIINGDMRIDQRRAGTSFTPTADGQYGVDRWSNRLTVSSKYSVQQKTDTTFAAAGFANYIRVTSLSAYTVGTNEWYALEQSIEGLNTLESNYGNASAISYTLSFWAQTSLSGTNNFGGCLQNWAATYSYGFLFALTGGAAPVKITITISGDTAHALSLNNASGLQVRFSLGANGIRLATVGSWANLNAFGAAGQVNLVSTNAATFDITGVKLEVGSIATPFVADDYSVSLWKCQRYYYKWLINSVTEVVATLSAYNTTSGWGKLRDFPTTMRVNPTVSYSALTDFQFYNTTGTNGYVVTSMSLQADTESIVTNSAVCGTAIFTAGQCFNMIGNATGTTAFTADAEL